MIRKRRGRSRSVILLILLLAVLVLFYGSVRYGSPEGLLLRIRSEVIGYYPRPRSVPTPLATVGADCH